MARRSRRLQNGVASDVTKIQEIAIKKKETLLRTAAYGRLSVENGGNETDMSLQMQMQMLYQFIESHVELQLEDSYLDNGYSGTKFDRPEFVRLMNDVKNGRIQCIVVKDFSRFGRDYLETGYYMETLFPYLNVRFISVTDEFDSIREEDRNSLAVPVKNMINAMYAKDISKKICVARQVMQKMPDAMPIGTPPFGYKFSEDKKRFLSDEDTAPIVRMVFAWAKMGLPLKDIGKRMELIGAITPGQSRNVKCGKEKKPAHWRADTVYKILHHPGYAGDVCTGRMRQAMYKSEKHHRIAQEEWTVRKNAHEPLTTREDRELILQTMQEHSAISRGENQIHHTGHEQITSIFKGMVYCADCGRIMNYRRYMHDYTSRRKIGGSYVCPRENGKSVCGGRIVYEDFLKILVMDQIHILIKSMCDRKKMLDMIHTSQGGKNALLSAQKKMLALNVKCAEIEDKQAALYENFAEGLLDRDDYQSIKERYNAETQQMKEELTGLEEKRGRLEGTIHQYAEVVKHLERYLDNREFNEVLVHKLVERISFSNSEGVEITFTCNDVYQEVLRMMEGNDTV